MWRFLGRLRKSGDPVVEQPAPAEPGVHAAAAAAREDELVDIDVRILEAWRRGEKVLVDRLLDERLEVRAPRPAPWVRPSVPVVPGRTT